MSNVLALDGRNATLAPAQPWMGRVEEIVTDGTVRVSSPDGRVAVCDWLESASNNVALDVGDAVLVMPALFSECPVLVGRIGRYRAPVCPQHQDKVTFEAKEQLTLRCGQSSIDLRADGKVLIRGDDVLVRAKSTKRIRAGTVSIN